MHVPPQYPYFALTDIVQARAAFRPDGTAFPFDAPMVNVGRRTNLGSVRDGFAVSLEVMLSCWQEI